MNAKSHLFLNEKVILQYISCKKKRLHLYLLKCYFCIVKRIIKKNFQSLFIKLYLSEVVQYQKYNFVE